MPVLVLFLPVQFLRMGSSQPRALSSIGKMHSRATPNPSLAAILLKEEPSRQPRICAHLQLRFARTVYSIELLARRRAAETSWLSRTPRPRWDNHATLVLNDGQRHFEREWLFLYRKWLSGMHASSSAPKPSQQMRLVGIDGQRTSRRSNHAPITDDFGSGTSLLLILEDERKLLKNVPDVLPDSIPPSLETFPL